MRTKSRDMHVRASFEPDRMAIEPTELSEILVNSSEELDRLSDVLINPRDVLTNLRDVLIKPKMGETNPSDVPVRRSDVRTDRSDMPNKLSDTLLFPYVVPMELPLDEHPSPPSRAKTARRPGWRAPCNRSLYLRVSEGG
jgi:hypothetical protein